MLNTPQHLLVFRFSALGDIAMTVPVVKSLLQQYPGLQITYVSNSFVAPLFSGIERLHFYAADLKGRHKGVKGLFTLYRELTRTYNFDAIADLHNVLRTKIIRFFFASSFKPVAVINKGRKEKKELTRKENKILKPLRPTLLRYADVFAALGLPLQLNQTPTTINSPFDSVPQENTGVPPQNQGLQPSQVSTPENPDLQSSLIPTPQNPVQQSELLSTPENPNQQPSLIPTPQNTVQQPSLAPTLQNSGQQPALAPTPQNTSIATKTFLIGVAPFAQHAEKMYPLEKMKEVLRLLLQHKNIKVLLFGGGKTEVALLQEWEKELPGIESVAGKMSFSDELKLIDQLDVMVSMDSANMHLASLSGVPVVSIWGATHPFAGFYGWGQSPDDVIQVDLYCRPCSVFGNKPCFRGDLACMHSITPVVVYNKIMEKLQP